MDTIRDVIKKDWFVLIILVVIIAVVYTNSLFNGLVTDDQGLVEEGSRLLTLGRIFQDFSAPLRTVVYSFAYLTTDLAPWALRLPNFLFHLGNSFLAYVIVKKLVNRQTALLTSVIFAVHPLLSETVVWISAGGYAQYSFFFLLSFWFYLKNTTKSYYLSLLFFVLMLLSLNRSLVLSGVFVIYEIAFVHKTGGLRKNWKKLLPYLGISLLWVGLFFTNIGERATSLDKVYYRDGMFYNPLIQWPLAIGSYLGLIFWPGHLTYVHTNNQTVWQYLLNIGVLIAYFGGLIWSFFKNKLVFFWLAFFLIPLLPNLTPFKIAFIVAERYVYLGSLGIIVLMAMGIARLLRIKELKLAVWSLFIILLIGFSIRTMIRNTDWVSGEKLWEKTAEVSQDSSQAHLNLGVQHGKDANALLKEGKSDQALLLYKQAEEEFIAAIMINPKIAEYYFNLGVVYAKTGRLTEALENFNKALELKPGYEEAQKAIELINAQK